MEQRKRKFMLLLPLLVLPFVIFLFWILGGGKESNISSGNVKAQGMNVKLPDAQFKKGKDKSKLSLYEEAGKDSAMRQEKIKNDPYYLLERQIKKSDSAPDENESRIMDKLAKLKLVLGHKTELPPQDPPTLRSLRPNTEQLDRLLSYTSGSKTHDPQLDRLSTMLDKVMAIQHPELVQDSLSKVARDHSPPVFAVERNNPSTEPTSFGSESVILNRFYDLSDDHSSVNESDNTIQAEIAETQILVSGSTVKLRLLNEIRINGHVIETNQFIYGIASLSGERLKIQFSSIRSGNNIFPISLEAFDLDGLAGIYIPGSLNRDVAKESGNQAISTLGLTSLDPSVGAQAAGAGIQAAKTLLSRKVKLVKVTVKAGYRVFLKDSNKK
jgi:conjugative transposon TraM protein